MHQSLPQRLYLLCHTVDKGKFELTDLQGRGQLLRAAALTELALDGLLAPGGGKVVRLSTEPPDDRVTVNDPQQVLALQERLRDAVLRGLDPAAIPLDELTMAAFAAEVEVTSVFTGKERREHKQALKTLAARFDGAVPGLRKALRDSYLSSRAVGGGWGT
jgi:hypothetical protein